MKVNITEFGAKANTREDAAFPTYRAAQKLQEHGGGTLVFEPGEYHFYPEKAFQHLCWISNHDSGLRNIGMPFFKLKGLEVVATGARFIFHGQMIPVWFGDCENVNWTGGTIDWEVPLHAEAKVSKNTLYGVEIDIQSPGAMRTVEGNAFLAGENWEDELHDFVFYDSDTRRVLPGTEDHFCNGWFAGQYRFETINASRFRIHFRDIPTVRPPDGTHVVLQAANRHCPGLVLDDSHGVSIDALTIRHCGSMGILGQNSGNIRIHNVEIAPAHGTGRFLSAGADATHFLNCSGNILITGCTFQGMLDDATNVHGHYAPIEQVLSPDTLLLRHGHNQQRGFRIAKIGEQVALVRSDNFKRIQKARIIEKKRVNDSYLILRLDTKVPHSDCPLVVENLDRIPNLTMQDCHISGNRARGMLIATEGKVLIENNTIAAPGAGIAIMPDCNLWFESGPTRDVTIKGNHFDQNVSSPGWGDAVIFIDPSIVNGQKDQNDFLNQSIRIENNRITLSESERILRAKSVMTLVFSENIIERQEDGPTNPEIHYTITDCGQFEQEKNDFH